VGYTNEKYGYSIAHPTELAEVPQVPRPDTPDTDQSFVIRPTELDGFRVTVRVNLNPTGVELDRWAQVRPEMSPAGTVSNLRTLTVAGLPAIQETVRDFGGLVFLTYVARGGTIYTIWAFAYTEQALSAYRPAYDAMVSSFALR